MNIFGPYFMNRRMLHKANYSPQFIAYFTTRLFLIYEYSCMQLILAKHLLTILYKFKLFKSFAYFLPKSLAMGFFAVLICSYKSVLYRNTFLILV